MKKVFSEIKNETGVNDSSELLALFMDLEEKANTLKVFISELEKEIAELDGFIREKENKMKLYEWESQIFVFYIHIFFSRSFSIEF